MERVPLPLLGVELQDSVLYFVRCMCYLVLFLFGAWGRETEANPWMVSYVKATKDYVKKLKDAKKYLTEMLSGWARFSSCALSSQC